MKNDNLDFRVMMRRDNFEMLVHCTPKASHRLLEIIAEGTSPTSPMMRSWKNGSTASLNVKRDDFRHVLTYR